MVGSGEQNASAGGKCGGVNKGALVRSIAGCEEVIVVVIH